MMETSGDGDGDGESDELLLESIPQSILDLEKEASTSLVATTTTNSLKESDDSSDDNVDDGKDHHVASIKPRQGTVVLDQPLTEDWLYQLPHPMLELEIAPGAKLTTASAKTLAQELDWSFVIKLRILHQPKLGPRGVLPLARGWKTLLELALVDCRIQHLGIPTLAPLLPQSLQALNLSHNHIGRDGAWKLASCLPTQLKVLDLSHNAIGDEGCSAVANHRHGLPSRVLNLGHNQIGNVGAKALAKALVESSSMTTSTMEEVRLEHNQIGDDGASALTEVLDQCSSLKILDLSGNAGLSESRLHVLNVMLRHHNSPNKKKSKFQETNHGLSLEDHRRSSRLQPLPPLVLHQQQPTIRAFLDLDEQAWKEEVSNLESDSTIMQCVVEKLQALQSAALLNER